MTSHQLEGLLSKRQYITSDGEREEKREPLHTTGGNLNWGDCCHWVKNPPAEQETGVQSLGRPWDFPGKNTGVGCHFLLQGTFSFQGLNLQLMHCKQILLLLSH